MQNPPGMSPHIHNLFESALDAVVGMDEAGTVIAWNRSAEQIFGWTASLAIGRNMGELIVPHQHRAAHEAGLRRYLQTGHGPVLNNRIQITALDTGGREFPVELSVIPIVGDDRTVFYAFIRSLEEQENSRRQLQQRAIEAEILFEISQKLVDEISSTALAEFCLQKICEVTGCSVGHLYEVGGPGGGAELRSSGLFHIAEERYAPAREISRRTTFVRGQGLPGRVWASEAPLVIEQIQNDDNFQRADDYAALGLVSGFAFPVRRRGKVRAVMEFFSATEIPLNDHLIKTAYTVSGQVSLALDRKEESESREMLRRELAHRVGNSMSILASIFRNCCKSAASVAELKESFETRLLTIGKANRHFIEAVDGPASLRTLVEEAVQLFPNGSALSIEGDPVDVMPSAIMPLSLMLHELVTNSLKHGAVSRPAGTVAVSWSVRDSGQLHVLWKEVLDAPVADSGREGYGTVLIRAVVERMLGGSFQRTFSGHEYAFLATISQGHFQKSKGGRRSGPEALD